MSMAFSFYGGIRWWLLVVSATSLGCVIPGELGKSAHEFAVKGRLHSGSMISGASRWTLPVTTPVTIRSLPRNATWLAAAVNGIRQTLGNAQVESVDGPQTPLVVELRWPVGYSEGRSVTPLFEILGLALPRPAQTFHVDAHVIDSVDHRVIHTSRIDIEPALFSPAVQREREVHDAFLRYGERLAGMR